MPDRFSVETRGELALNSLYQALGTLGQIQAAFGASNANVQSCSANANIIMDQLSKKPDKMGRMSVMRRKGLMRKPYSMPMTLDSIVSEIMHGLEEANAVYVSIANDHHFVTVPISGNGVGIVQAFQGSYSLADWFAWRGFGVLDKPVFRQAMTDLLCSNEQAIWVAAAKKLFSFDLATTTPAGSSNVKARVAQDIADWFQNRPSIKGYAIRPL